MRAAAALRIVCIGLLQEGQRLVFGVAKGSRLATRGGGRGSIATADIGGRETGCGCVAGAQHANLVPRERYGLRSRITGLGTPSPRLAMLQPPNANQELRDVTCCGGAADYLFAATCSAAPSTRR